ncbi:hypothetical protein RvY_06509 [Ramazzottius varieornatus]|uniref:Chitin-binding type-2 domain-containing protein n=1 Tax=Ramazzottius varieornatus TaxID=947166 RepID=A0A1D1V544_RAMVA|nr:hypothetical protein RvY_06509 [Ramazzottius varieornatus]
MSRPSVQLPLLLLITCSPFFITGQIHRYFDQPLQILSHRTEIDTPAGGPGSEPIAAASSYSGGQMAAPQYGSSNMKPYQSSVSSYGGQTSQQPYGSGSSGYSSNNNVQGYPLTSGSQDYGNSHDSNPSAYGFNCYGKPPALYGDANYDCRIFHVCQADGRGDTLHCPKDTKFNNYLGVCDWEFKIDRTCMPLYKEEQYSAANSGYESGQGSYGGSSQSSYGGSQGSYGGQQQPQRYRRRR